MTKVKPLEINPGCRNANWFMIVVRINCLEKITTFVFVFLWTGISIVFDFSKDL